MLILFFFVFLTPRLALTFVRSTSLYITVNKKYITIKAFHIGRYLIIYLLLKIMTDKKAEFRSFYFNIIISHKQST